MGVLVDKAENQGLMGGAVVLAALAETIPAERVVMAVLAE